ncbi:hypothetical protein D9M70_591480 [compost metagenome]
MAVLPLLARKDAVKTDVGRLTVWHFNTNRALTRDRCFNTKRLRSKVESDIGFERGDTSQLNATWRTERILRHLWPNVSAFHFDINTKLT